MSVRPSPLASVFLVVYSDHDDVRIESAWTTVEAARDEESRLDRDNTEPGAYHVTEYALNKRNGWLA